MIAEIKEEGKLVNSRNSDGKINIYIYIYRCDSSIRKQRSANRGQRSRRCKKNMFRVGRKDFDGLKRSICREERNIREKASTRHLTPIYARVYRNTTKAGNGGNGSKIWSTVGLTEFDRLRRPIGRKQRASNQGGGGEEEEEPITICIRATIGTRDIRIAVTRAF